MAIKKRSATVVPGASGAAAAVKNPQASKTSFWGELPQHVMSGISRMVPTLIMGGVILAFSQLIAYSWLKIPAEIGINILKVPSNLFYQTYSLSGNSKFLIRRNYHNSGLAVRSGNSDLLATLVVRLLIDGYSQEAQMLAYQGTN